jgi:hypothetical protein
LADRRFSNFREVEPHDSQNRIRTGTRTIP